MARMVTFWYQFTWVVLENSCYTVGVVVLLFYLRLIGRKHKY